ncbi:MAG: O-antigen ligase family protein [Acetobacteraceae bacterium]|nr:O-antigen ligase family protein [Acetobacteraceae bacterium]
MSQTVLLQNPAGLAANWRVICRWGAVIATGLTPLFLLHGRSIAEMTITITDACFVLHCALSRDWRWLSALWVRIGLVWWGWLVLCSIPLLGFGAGGLGSLLQAIAVLRFLLFAAALQFWVLTEPATRTWLWRLLAGCFAYIGIHALVQFATGHNLYGHPPGFAGELTGPFDKPRAGPVFSRLLPVVLVPPAAALLARRTIAATAGGYVLLLGGVCLMVLFSQRMPLLLTGLGLAVAGLLLPRLRRVVIASAAAALVLVAASAVISPLTYHRLVEQFSQQMEGFGRSHYGQIFARSVLMAEANPVTGRGFDGFRTGCPLPEYYIPSSNPALADSVICTTHPHNFYMQALTDAGFPGLASFAAMALAWPWPLGRGLPANTNPRRVGLFASALMVLWTIASTSSFTSMPLEGWFFLLLGFGLAEADAATGRYE